MEDKNQLNAKSFVNSVFKYSIPTWVGFLIYGISVILGTRWLSAEVYGDVNFFITASSLVMNIAVLGLDHSYLRFYNTPPEGISQKQLQGLCFVGSTVGIAVLTIIVGLFLAGPVSIAAFGAENYTALYLLFLNAFFLTVTRFVNLTYRLRGNVLMFGIQNILVQLFSRVFYLIAAFFDPSFNMVVIFYVIGMGLFSGVFLLLARKDLFPKNWVFKWSVLKPLLGYGVPLAPTQILVWLNTLISQYFAGALIDGPSRGIFISASTVANLVIVIQSGFASFWSPFVFENYETQQQRIIKVHDFMVYLGGILTLALIFFEDILFFLVGSSFREGMAIFPIMLIGPMLAIISETTMYGMNIRAKTYLDTIANIACVATNLVLCQALIPTLGITGAAVALGVGNSILFLLRTFFGQRLYRSVASYGKTAFTIVLLIATAGVCSYFNDQLVLRLGISGGVAVALTLMYIPQFKKCLVMAKDLFLTVVGMLKKPSKKER